MFHAQFCQTHSLSDGQEQVRRLVEVKEQEAEAARKETEAGNSFFIRVIDVSQHSCSPWPGRRPQLSRERQRQITNECCCRSELCQVDEVSDVLFQNMNEQNSSPLPT